MSLIFVALLICVGNCAKAGHPVDSAGPVEESEVGKALPAPLEPGGPAPKGSEAGEEHAEGDRIRPGPHTPSVRLCL